jgi:hypothetical protein
LPSSARGYRFSSGLQGAVVKWKGKGPQNLIGGSIPSRASKHRQFKLTESWSDDIFAAPHFTFKELPCCANS